MPDRPARHEKGIGEIVSADFLVNDEQLGSDGSQKVLRR
jgi:hypothetical protein